MKRNGKIEDFFVKPNKSAKLQEHKNVQYTPTDVSTKVCKVIFRLNQSVYGINSFLAKMFLHILLTLF